MVGNTRDMIEAISFWTKKGYTPQQAAAIEANIFHESGGRADARGDGGRAHGLFQHHPDRRARILAATGIDMSTANAMDQRRAAAWEMKNEAVFRDAVFRRINNPAEAAAYFTAKFERPADISGESAKRGATANKIFNEIDYARAEWLQPLISDPKHLARELEALGTDEAKQRLADINRISVVDTKYKEVLAKGALLVAQESKDVLKQAGVETSSRNLSLGEIVGGHTAVKLLQMSDKGVTLQKLIAEGVLPKSMVTEFAKTITPEMKKQAGLSAEAQDDPEKMTLDNFLSIVDETGKKQKLSAYEKARGQIKSAGNEALLQQLLKNDLGFMEFLLLMLMVLAFDKTGIDLGAIAGVQQKAESSPRLQGTTTQKSESGRLDYTNEVALMSQKLQNSGVQSASMETRGNFTPFSKNDPTTSVAMS